VARLGVVDGLQWYAEEFRIYTFHHKHVDLEYINHLYDDDDDDLYFKKIKTRVSQNLFLHKNHHYHHYRSSSSSLLSSSSYKSPLNSAIMNPRLN
jgi:G3E family GTPase